MYWWTLQGRLNPCNSAETMGFRMAVTLNACNSEGYQSQTFMMIVLLLFLQKQNLANAIYLFGLGTLLSGLGLKHMRIRSHHDLAGTLVTPYSWEDHGGVLRLLPVYPSQCSLLQVTSTDVAFPPFCRSCPCDRHDLYLPSIPASLQTLGRCECAAACALAPLGVRIISPRTSYRSFLRAIWTFV
jgi:hypothetical protein